MDLPHIGEGKNARRSQRVEPTGGWSITWETNLLEDSFQSSRKSCSSKLSTAMEVGREGVGGGVGVGLSCSQSRRRSPKISFQIIDCGRRVKYNSTLRLINGRMALAKQAINTKGSRH